MDEQQAFNQFWAIYPRKVGKGAARKAWAKLKPSGDLLRRMIHALAWQRHQPQWKKDGGAFVPHPSTWLTQERWDDEPFYAAVQPTRALDTHSAAIEQAKNWARMTPAERQAVIQAEAEGERKP